MCSIFKVVPYSPSSNFTNSSMGEDKEDVIIPILQTTNLRLGERQRLKVTWLIEAKLCLCISSSDFLCCRLPGPGTDIYLGGFPRPK